MKISSKKSVGILFAIVLTISACKHSLVISRVDYSQPIETVLKPDQNGMVEDARHGLSFNVMPFQYAETKDTSSVTIKPIRYIRDQKGFYYITSSGYHNVYVMEAQKDKLKLSKKIKISDEGLSKPALNQRQSYIQLVDQSDGQSWQLNAKGIQHESSMAKKEGK